MIGINKKIGSVKVSFNPNYYKRAITNYKKGNFRDIIALMEQSEIDSHVAGCLMGRRAGFLREWRVSELSDSAADLAVKDFVESVFMGLNMRELFEDIHDARLKKFSVIELDWETEDNRQVITGARKLNQKYFKYDDDGVLKIDWGRDLRDIPEDSALVNEITRNPVLLPVLRDYILKEFGLESWAGFLETFGEAFVIGTYPPGANSEFKTELEAAVNALSSSSRGIMPEGANINIIETQRTTGDHERFKDAADQGISISILGHANAVRDSNGMRIGENLAPYKVRRELALGDIYFIENQIYQIVKMLVDRNFGHSRYPAFTIDKSEPVNVTERLELLRFAYDAGYKIHPDEIAKLGLFKFEDQEPLVKPDNLLNLLD